MPSSRKSLLDLTVETVTTCLAFDPSLSMSAKFRALAAVRNSFDAACFASFDLDPELPTHRTVIDTWWLTAMDLYHFDLQMRRGYDPNFKG